MSEPFPQDHVLLVDAGDRPVGHMEKLAAHRSAALHRAYSIFVFDPAGRLLLQQRAPDKYHSGGLWSNTCCSHPHAHAPLIEQAQARLAAEMGFSCPLTEIGTVHYHVAVGDGLWEHEYNHILAAMCAATPDPDPREVGGWQWVEWEDLEKNISINTIIYSSWLIEIITKMAPLLKGFLRRHRQRSSA